MKKVLFFNPLLLKEDFVKGVKKRLTYDKKKVLLLKELLTRTNSELILIWFSLQDEKDLELVPFLKEVNIIPIDYISCDHLLHLRYKQKTQQEYKEEQLAHQKAVREYPKTGMKYFIVDTQFNCDGDKSAVLGRNYFNQNSFKTILSKFR